jgi:hypothetical protein
LKEKEGANNNIVIKDKPEKQNNEATIKDSLSFNQPINQQKDTIASKEIVVENKEDKQEIQQADQPTKDSTANTTSQQPIRLKKKPGKWQWGILLEKGESHTAKGLQFTGSSPAADMIYANQNSGTGAAPSGAVAAYSPSARRPSGSFALGTFAKKSLSPKFDLNLSLNFLYLSTKMMWVRELIVRFLLITLFLFLMLVNTTGPQIVIHHTPIVIIF